MGTVVAWTKGLVEPVRVARTDEGMLAVAVEPPRVPVHCAPCGQQATLRLLSAVQRASRRQQRPGALSAVQA